jgi:hypothetical protein
MKRSALVIALAFASASAFGAAWGEGNSDTQGNILDEKPMAYVGTGLGSAAPMTKIYGGFASDEALDGFSVGSTTPRSSSNPDEAGSILVDVGARP